MVSQATSSELWRSAEWMSDTYIDGTNVRGFFWFVVAYVSYLADCTCELLSVITPDVDGLETYTKLIAKVQ